MLWGLVALGYLLGSIPFGLLITRAVSGTDVRTQGSGNIGATNVARVAGKGWGALVLVLDALKGAGPVLLAVKLGPEAWGLHVGVGLAAFVGHVFPVWLRFKGGKGVATALGVLGVLLPIPAAVGLVVWLTVMGVWRVSSVGSLVGGALAVGASFALESPLPYAVFATTLWLAMLWTHRGNIARLLTRSERRV